MGVGGLIVNMYICIYYIISVRSHNNNNNNIVIIIIISVMGSIPVSLEDSDNF